MSIFSDLGYKLDNIGVDFDGRWIPSESTPINIYIFEGGRKGYEWMYIIRADSYHNAYENLCKPADETCYPIFHYKNDDNLKVILKSLHNNMAISEYIIVSNTIEELGWVCKHFDEGVSHWVPNTKNCEDVYLFEGGKAGNQWLEIIYADNYEQALYFWRLNPSKSCHPIFYFKNIENLKIILNCGT